MGFYDVKNTVNAGSIDSAQCCNRDINFESILSFVVEFLNSRVLEGTLILIVWIKQIVTV